jgi:hypothetical protein
MFETLMRPGSYRVDYLNEAVVGKPSALGFYVCGELPPEAPYSLAARSHLLSGLVLIHQHLGPENLAAVYLDVHTPPSMDRPAFAQLKRDVRTGMFRKIFVSSDCITHHKERLIEELMQLSFEVGDLKLITHQDGVWTTLCLDVHNVACMCV